MKERAVTNSTCLIALERIGQLDLLPALFEEVVAPPSVHEELGAPPSWLAVKSPANRTTVDAFRLLVHEGEAEAIALAAELGWRVILDDRKARGLARRMGLKVVGTIGLLVRAKQSRIIPAIKPLITALEGVGFRLDADLKAEALRLAEE